MSQTVALRVGMSCQRSVGAVNKVLGKSEVLSFRRRPRKSNNPCRAWTNSVQDEFRSWPLNLIEKKVPFKISWGNKGKRTIRLAKNKTNISLPNLEKKVVVVFNIDNQGQVMSQKTNYACPTPSEQQQQQQLPPGFKNYIKELGATGDPVLVIQKRLFASDVNRGLQRLSIPVRQMVNHGFLTEEERSGFNSKDKQAGIDAILIEPSLAESRIKLKKWYMDTSEVYVLVRGWNEVVKRNGLKLGQIVQLWSFKKGLQLYFVLIRL